MQDFRKTIGKKLLEIIDLVKCSICWDVIKDIRELPCKHKFCANCLKTHKDGKTIFTCPLCKMEISKRKILNRDAGLDSLCVFMQKLCEDVTQHYNCDLTGVLSKNNTPNRSLNSDLISNIVETGEQSSEENDFIPCTIAEKKRKIQIKNSKRGRPKNTKPTGAKKPYNQCGPSNSHKEIPTHQETPAPMAPCTSRMSHKKLEIMRWLHDTRNKFERISQTQKSINEDVPQEDIELFSISQAKHIRTKKNSDIGKNFGRKRSNSVDISPPSVEVLKRHSLECTSPTRLKQYQKLNTVDTIENKLIIEFMEDEVLNVIERKSLGESNQIEKLNEIETIDLTENEGGEEKENITKQRSDFNKNIVKRGQKIETSSSTKKNEQAWPTIDRFKKTIKGKGKISGTTNQKNNEPTVKPLKQNIDMEKMEEYFSKAMPELIQNNIPPPSQNVSESERLKQAVNYIDDIYGHSTQPLSSDLDNLVDRKESIKNLTKRLESSLITPEGDITADHDEIIEIFPVIENIFNTLKKSLDPSGRLCKVIDKKIQTESSVIVPSRTIQVQNDFPTTKIPSHRSDGSSNKNNTAEMSTVTISEETSKLSKEIEKLNPLESEIAIDEILEQCQSERRSQIQNVPRNASIIVENKRNENENVDSQTSSSQGSKIICTIQSLKAKVNRKLSFELAMKEREEFLKKLPSMNSEGSGDRCNRFVNENLSIRFETESQIEDNQHSVENEVIESTSAQCNEVLVNNSKNQKVEQTQADLELLNYCEELIEQANKQPVSDSKTNPTLTQPKQNETQIVEQPHNDNYDRIETQDLLNHCDQLIENAHRNIEVELDTQNVNMCKKRTDVGYGNSQIATTSKAHQERVSKNVDDLTTQALLDHCNVLIENYTDDLDDVKEKTVEENLERTSEIKRKLEDTQEGIPNPKKIKIIQNVCLIDNIDDDFNTSSEEMFNDLDLVEATPPKAKNSPFLDRLSCSQALNGSSKSFSKMQDICIVPPPPGFDDDDDVMIIEPESEHQNHITQLESENIIPNSLSPEKIGCLPLRKPLSLNNSNKKNQTNSQTVPTLSQEIRSLSPIRNENSNQVNVIQIAQQSKFSPLTILPKDSPVRSPLTSTPKQKSILKYVTSKGLSQNKNTEEPFSLKSQSIPCIAYSRLSRQDTELILKMCNKNLATRSTKLVPEVTHLIVSVDKSNYVRDHTMKYINAIAAGIWVLNSKWIEQCLAQNMIVDEEPYEVIDSSGVPSPRISRLTRLRNPLFKGFKFFLLPPFVNAPIGDIENIIKLLSGVIVASVKDLTNSRDHICLVIFDDVSNSEDNEKYEFYLENYKVLAVDMHWLSSCVSHYKITSIRPHIQYSEDALENLDYPDVLLADVPSSINRETQM